MPDRTFDIVKLAFRSPLHLSLGKPSLERSEEILHSDTLKSAIAVSAMKVTGMTPGTEQRFDPEFFHSFQVSSSFPYCEGEFFFPRPVSTRVLRGITLEGVRGVAKREKELKKIRYLGRTFFEKLLSGQHFSLSHADRIAGGSMASDLFHQYGKPEEVRPFRKREIRRVRVARIGEVDEEGNALPPTPFYMQKIHFRQKAGLFFLLCPQANFDEDLFKAALRLLADEGLGLNRHAGNGHFEAKQSSIHLNLPERGDQWMNLSLYCPQWNKEKGIQELDTEALQDCSYQLIKRGGWIASPEEEQFLSFRKRSVFMFQEGSIFSFPESAPVPLIKGKCVNLQPDEGIRHDVLRDGRGIFFPVQPSDHGV